MHRPTFKKMALCGFAATTVVVALAGANLAGAGTDQPKPGTGAATQVNRDVVLKELPHPDGPNGRKTILAMWLNGRIYKVQQSVKEYEIFDKNGARTGGVRMVPQSDIVAVNPDGSTSPLPARNPAFNGVTPTPEQEAEMKRMVGADKPPPPPRGARVGPPTP